MDSIGNIDLMVNFLVKSVESDSTSPEETQETIFQISSDLHKLSETIFSTFKILQTLDFLMFDRSPLENLKSSWIVGEKIENI